MEPLIYADYIFDLKFGWLLITSYNIDIFMVN